MVLSPATAKHRRDERKEFKVLDKNLPEMFMTQRDRWREAALPQLNYILNPHICLSDLQNSLDTALADLRDLRDAMEEEDHEAFMEAADADEKDRTKKGTWDNSDMPILMRTHVLYSEVQAIIQVPSNRDMVHKRIKKVRDWLRAMREEKNKPPFVKIKNKNKEGETWVAMKKFFWMAFSNWFRVYPPENPVYEGDAESIPSSGSEKSDTESVITISELDDPEPDDAEQNDAEPDAETSEFDEPQPEPMDIDERPFDGDWSGRWDRVKGRMTRWDAHDLLHKDQFKAPE